jgi:hypothetical protein
VDPIDQLTQTWRRGLAGRRLADALRGWGKDEPVLVGFEGSPERLFRFLRTPPGPERDRVFCALLRLAKRDQVAGLVVLEALVPGLKQLAGRFLLSLDDRDELWSLLLLIGWEQVTSYPVERRPHRIAANLLLDTRKSVLAELEALRGQGRLPDAWEPVPVTGVAGSVDLLVGRAVAAGVLRDEDAQLILKTRVDGRSLPAVADELGERYITVYARRERAERRLLLFLRGQPVKKRARDRHISGARSVASRAADSASGGAVT